MNVCEGRLASCFSRPRSLAVFCEDHLGLSRERQSMPLTSYDDRMAFMAYLDMSKVPSLARSRRLPNV